MRAAIDFPENGNGLSRLNFCVALLCIGLAPAPALAQAENPDRIQIKSACSYTESRTGWWGSTTAPLDYQIAEGATFSRKGDEDGAPSFCGDAKLHAVPLGWIPANLCMAVAAGKPVAAPDSKKAIQSDCVVSDPESMNAQYRDADFLSYAGKGAAKLHGQAFLRTVGGDVKTCAGSKVLLVPGNAYGDEVITQERAGLTAKADSRFIARIRESICDAQGNFTFASVPAGRWYVSTVVTWGVPHIEQPGESAGPITSAIFGIAPPPKTDEQGGELIQPVSLEAGDNQAYLTDRDLR